MLSKTLGDPLISLTQYPTCRGTMPIASCVWTFSEVHPASAGKWLVIRSKTDENCREITNGRTLWAPIRFSPPSTPTVVIITWCKVCCVSQRTSCLWFYVFDRNMHFRGSSSVRRPCHVGSESARKCGICCRNQIGEPNWIRCLRTSA